jgi:ribosomal protein L11 methyltransferase
VPSYYIHIDTPAADKDLLLAEFWEAGTTGISETELPGGRYRLIASFDSAEQAARFGVPVHSDDTDWVALSRREWHSRQVGERFFFAPSWSDEPTPPSRWRIPYQDGAACGSGEHPSTRQTLVAIEEFLKPGMAVLDLGCGAGILSLGSLLLGAASVIAVDPEEDSCRLTRELAHVPVVRGTADCLRSGMFDLVAANISATVLINYADEILRLARPGARIILAGFGVEEAVCVKRVFALGPVSERIEGEWSCLVLDLPLH